MDDFLYLLKMELDGRIPEGELPKQISLYENYINEHVAEGQPLESVLRTLGDPSDIAAKIVEAYGKKAASAAVDAREAPAEDPDPLRLKISERVMPRGDLDADSTPEEINRLVMNPGRGIKAEFKENEGWDIRLGKLKLNSWYGTLLILLIVLVVASLLKQIH